MLIQIAMLLIFVSNELPATEITESAERLRVVAHLANRSQESFERWDDVILSYEYTTELLIKNFSASQRDPGLKRLSWHKGTVQRTKGKLDWSYCRLQGSVRADSKADQGITWYDPTSKQSANMETKQLLSLVSIFTPEHWLYIDDLQMGQIAGHKAAPIPKTGSRRAIRREVKDAEPSLGYTDVIDVREWLSSSGIPMREILKGYEKALRTSDVGEKRPLKDRIRIFRNADESLVRLVVSYVHDDGTGRETARAETIYSKDADWNAVDARVYREGRLSRLKEFTFRMTNVGSWPSRYVQETYMNGTEIRDYRREFTLTNVKVRPKFDAGYFSYPGLGLKNGERVDDRIQGKVFIFANGSLADVDKVSVVRAGSPTSADSVPVQSWRTGVIWILVAATLLGGWAILARKRSHA